MFVLNPRGNTGVICDDCSVIIFHEVTANEVSVLPDVHLCIGCLEAINALPA